MKRISQLPVMMMFAIVCVAAAQTAPQRVVVVPGRILDVKSGRYLTGQAITIEGDKIVAISVARNPSQEEGPPVGIREIRLPNLTVLPGLIDTHTHITFDPFKGG